MFRIIVFLIVMAIEARADPTSDCKELFMNDTLCEEAGVFTKPTYCRFDEPKVEVMTDEEILVGGPFYCESETREGTGCIGSHQVSATVAVTYSSGIYFKNEKFAKNFIGETGSKFGFSKMDGKVRSETMSCNIDQGYKAEIRFAPRVRKISGPIYYYKESSLLFKEPRCGKLDYFELKQPVYRSDGAPEGDFKCTNHRPIANVTTVSFESIAEKLGNGTEYDVLGGAFHNLLLWPPPMNEHIVQSYKKWDKQAWVVGRCYNMEDEFKYKPLCRGCLKYLVDEMWSKSKNSRGAKWMVNDCYLHYEFYPITT